MKKLSFLVVLATLILSSLAFAGPYVVSSGFIKGSLSGELDPYILGDGTLFIYQSEQDGNVYGVFTDNCEMDLVPGYYVSIYEGSLYPLNANQQQALERLVRFTEAVGTQVHGFYYLNYCNSMSVVR